MKNTSPFCFRLRAALGVALAASVGVASVIAAAPRWRARALPANKVAFGFGAELMATDTLRPSERSFLEKAAELSGEEMRLARVAVSQATSADLRNFAQQLAADQQRIYDSVAALRRKKGTLGEPTTPPTELTPGAGQKLAQKAGADFDREFLRVVSATQADVVTLFETAMADAKDTDVRELVGSYLPTLRDHQNQLSALKKALE